MEYFICLKRAFYFPYKDCCCWANIIESCLFPVMKNSYGLHQEIFQEISELFCSVAFVNKIGDAFKEWLFFLKKLFIELLIYLFNEFRSLAVLFSKVKNVWSLSLSVCVYQRHVGVCGGQRRVWDSLDWWVWDIQHGSSGLNSGSKRATRTLASGVGAQFPS